jgi:hypothetical protein
MMPATRGDILSWLIRAKDKGATHMLVACDLHDYEDYPVFVFEGDDIREVVRHYTKVMNSVREVYALHLDLEKQLNEERAYHLD